MKHDKDSLKITADSETRKRICAQSKWAVLMGIFLIILGSIATGTAIFTTFTTVILFGSLLAAGGIIQIIEAIRSPVRERFLLHILLGILNIVTGLLMVIKPYLGAVSLTLLLAAIFISSGVFRMSAALAVKFSNRFWLFLSGLVSLILGILIFIQWPAASLWVIGLFIGIELIFSGWWFIISGYAVKQNICFKDQELNP